jgi:hypothetical protein
VPAPPPAPAAGEALLTIAQVVTYFGCVGGDVTYAAVEDWIRRGHLPRAGYDNRGRVLVRYAEVLDAEAVTWRATRGRPRRACVTP